MKRRAGCAAGGRQSHPACAGGCSRARAFSCTRDHGGDGSPPARADSRRAMARSDRRAGGLACVGRRRGRRDGCPSGPSAESQPARPARDPLHRAADAQIPTRCAAIVTDGRATIHVHGKAPTIRASGCCPGVLCGRARPACAGSSCVRGPGFCRCARAGRGAWPTVPKRPSRRGAGGLARACPGGRRTRGGSAPCRCCLRGSISSQHTAAAPEWRA